MSTIERITAFAPDADPTTPGVITACDNLVPTLRGYAGGFSGVNVGMDALPGPAISAAVLSDLGGANRLIVGMATHLYGKSGSSWNDISRATPAYNASETYPWRFAQFGDTSLAVNKGDVLQAFTSGDFDDVSGAPKAALMCVVSQFVMLANTNEGTFGDSFDRWWCSALLDYTDWTPDISTQCTTGRLVDSPGGITGLKALGYDVVAYKEKSMYLGRYAGPPAVWDWTLIPGEIGCVSNEAIADIGTAHLFVGGDDFWMFDGSRPVSVGTPVREWFFADADPSAMHTIRHSVDRVNALVYWFYRRVGSSSLNGCIAYNWKANKWGIAHREIECAVDYITGGFTWDTLPLTTWDSWPSVAYDSPFWTNGSRCPAFIGTDHVIYSLTGGSVSASFTTGHYGQEDAFSLLSRVNVRFLKRPAGVSMTNFYQNIHGDAWVQDATTADSSGRFDVLRSAPWHRARFDLTGDFEFTGAAATIQWDGVL